MQSGFLSSRLVIALKIPRVVKIKTWFQETAEHGESFNLDAISHEKNREFREVLGIKNPSNHPGIFATVQNTPASRIIR